MELNANILFTSRNYSQQPQWDRRVQGAEGIERKEAFFTSVRVALKDGELVTQSSHSAFPLMQNLLASLLVLGLKQFLPHGHFLNQIHNILSSFHHSQGTRVCFQSGSKEKRWGIKPAYTKSSIWDNSG